MRLVLCSAFAVLALSTAAVAQTTPVETASQNTEDQIDAYLRTSPTLSLPSDAEIDALQEERERKVHGEFGVAVGSHGYRDVYARSDFPVGKTGVLTVAVRESRFKGRVGRHDRQSLALGLSLGGSTQARDCRWSMHHDAPEPGRDEGRRCEAERIQRLGPAPLARPMF